MRNKELASTQKHHYNSEVTKLANTNRKTHCTQNNFEILNKSSKFTIRKNLLKFEDTHDENMNLKVEMSKRAQSCRNSLHEEQKLVFGDKIAKIKDMFNKFCKENDRIQSTKTIENKPNNSINNGMLLAMGIGKIETICNIKIKNYKREFMSLLNNHNL